MYLNKYNLTYHNYEYDDSSDDEDLLLLAKVYNWWRRIPTKYHYRNPYLEGEEKKDIIKKKKCNLM